MDGSEGYNCFFVVSCDRSARMFGGCLLIESECRFRNMVVFQSDKNVDAIVISGGSGTGLPSYGVYTYVKVFLFARAFSRVSHLNCHRVTKPNC